LARNLICLIQRPGRPAGAFLLSGAPENTGFPEHRKRTLMMKHAYHQPHDHQGRHDAEKLMASRRMLSECRHRVAISGEIISSVRAGSLYSPPPLGIRYSVAMTIFTRKRIAARIVICFMPSADTVPTNILPGLGLLPRRQPLPPPCLNFNHLIFTT
jgi:hypothetical protein